MRNAGWETENWLGTSQSDVRSGQRCPDLKVECGEFSDTIFTVSSEFTFGNNQCSLVNVFLDLADRDLTAYLSHSPPDVFSC